jgi:hypothetical protein
MVPKEDTELHVPWYARCMVPYWRQLEAGFVVDFFLANSTTFVGLFSPDFIALLNNFVIIDARLT